MDILPPKESITINGKLYPTTGDRRLRISDFHPVPPEETPGNVGICFSGGGSVALVSALGQMRALNELGLLEKAKAISSISGGSWATVPFCYLPESISDETFLGKFIANPQDLTLENLGAIPDQYLGSAVAAKEMNFLKLSGEALRLINKKRVLSARVWAVLVGRHILKPFGLYADNNGSPLRRVPTSFTYSEKEVREIKTENPTLKNVEFFLNQHAKREGRIRRPYHLCNAAMYIKRDVNGTQKTFLAPVTCTPHGSGIVVEGVGKIKLNCFRSVKVGGGLVSNHAFSSKFQKWLGQDKFTAKVPRNRNLFSLVDATAASSAFMGTIVEPKKSYLLTPKFLHWPPTPGVKRGGSLRTFPDGGGLEVTGLPFLLAYDDIDAALCFYNALSTIFKAPKSEDSDKKSDLQYPWNIVVDPWLPSLFGYTPFLHKEKKIGPQTLSRGYQLFRDVDLHNMQTKSWYYFAKNQIFPSELFPKVVDALWQSSQGESYQSPAIYFNDRMPVIKNELFGVKERTIKWCMLHYNPVQDFDDQLQPEVRGYLKRFVEAKQSQRHGWLKDLSKEPPYPPIPTDDRFPNFMLEDTQMDAKIMNLFAHFTAWNTYSQRETIKKLFTK
ncbi:MAG: hypothetical protein AAF998_21820 [Bacteroidota bacterium]